MKKAAFMFLIFIIILSFSLRAYSLLEPINKVDPVDILVEIEPGMSGRGIANFLEKEGVIKSSTVFYLLLRLQNINNLQAGYYRFSTSDSSLEIIEKLKNGDQESFNITIPEGFTLEEILNRFEALEIPEYEKGILRQEINSEISKLDLEKNLDAADYDPELIYPEEGIIVPTTYNFPMSYQEQDIAVSLIDYFKKTRLPLLKEAAADSDYSAYELLIIASLIEEEGKVGEEMKTIASVIYNRLADGMALQLDATVQYALIERTARVLYADLEVDSPYNTYQMNKLPPTPIASPGDLALESAIKPAETEYFFYFARKDGSHVFTKTYEEHLRQQRQLLN